ncbi:PHP domain-containing protein [Marisediminicola sp. LYQ85]|uniref:PHP domain-containing protein n=1 Tax=Marisediminicola sp. LYQ85 TaxID=3391062 RepID=UPI0039838A57
MSRVIDLHTHSSVSDGTETPARLVASAIESGLAAVALTDHDSTAGWTEAADAARGSALTVIPGMEFSTMFGWKSVHLLAYLFDPSDAGIVAETARIRDSRLRRAENIVSRISADYDLSWSDVLEQTSRGATVGRPHIADALVARGLVANRSAAFESILHPRSGYFEPHYAPDPLTAVKLVVAAGGVPVLAHPGTRGASEVIPESKLKALVGAGLFGLEIEHRDNTASGKQRLRELATTFGLATTGSSDYHGAGKPNRLGENHTDPRVLERIIERGTGSAPLSA